MENLKQTKAAVIAVTMMLSMPPLVHASDNSITILPAEGNVQCSDYAANKVIESMGDGSPVPIGTVSGPENQNDADNTGESADYTLDGNTTLGFSNSTTPIDFVVIKDGKNVTVIMYASGGVYADENITNGSNDISAFSLCYGLGNEAGNRAPTLTTEGNQTITVGEARTFAVSTTDDGLPDGTLTLTTSALPVSSTFTTLSSTDAIDGTFSWTPTISDVGIHTVTFTADDGEYTPFEEISITVVELATAPNCATSGFLDETGVTCPVAPASRSLVCNMQLDEEHYGFDIAEHCCVCNQGGDGTLVQCDPDLVAGETNTDTGLDSCFDTTSMKRPLEVTSHLEFNNDPYYCYTSGGKRTCYKY